MVVPNLAVNGMAFGILHLQRTVVSGKLEWWSDRWWKVFDSRSTLNHFDRIAYITTWIPDGQTDGRADISSCDSTSLCYA